MARINSELLQKLQSRLGVGQSQVYKLIDAKVRTSHLPRPLAAIALAGEHGINISRYATTDDLATMRQTAINTVPRPVVVEASEKATGGQPARRPSRKSPTAAKRRGNTVFVVHGRDMGARDGMFAFLRALGLRPLEWSQAMQLTKQGSPYVGAILEAAFREATAVVVLLTPDDEARLRKMFIKSSDGAYERNLTGQARANVLFEAGMAFGRDPNSTVLVQLGEVRPFSDIGGRHVMHLTDQASSRQELVTKLANAGCNVDTSGSDWLTVGAFSNRGARAKKPRGKKRSSVAKRRRR